MRALAAERDERVVSDLESLLSDGAVVRYLDEGIAHADVVVLVGAHEAAQLHLAGQQAFVGDLNRFRTEHDLRGAFRLVMFGADPDRIAAEPEVAEAIRISNRKRGQQDDSAHGIIHRAFTAIRLKDLEELEQNLSQLMEHGFVRRSLSTAHFPYRGQFPDLQGAMPALLLEMCVFSAPGVVEFLPALPEKLPGGRLEGVWLYTWVKMDSLEWSEKGLRAVLTPLRDQTLTLRCRRPWREFLVNGTPSAPEGDHVTVPVRAGETLQVKLSFRP